MTTSVIEVSSTLVQIVGLVIGLVLLYARLRSDMRGLHERQKAAAKQLRQTTGILLRHVSETTGASVVVRSGKPMRGQHNVMDE